MAGNIESLFDPERRKVLREAIRKGEGIFAGKGQAEPPSSSLGSPIRGNLMAITSPEVQMSDPPQFRVSERYYRPDDFLMLAIQYGDMSALKLALNHDADVNHKVLFLPANPDSGEIHPTRIGDPDVSTPLQYAVKLGRPDIIEYLRQNGAKE